MWNDDLEDDYEADLRLRWKHKASTDVSRLTIAGQTAAILEELNQLSGEPMASVLYVVAKEALARANPESALLRVPHGFTLEMVKVEGRDRLRFAHRWFDVTLTENESRRVAEAMVAFASNRKVKRVSFSTNDERQDVLVTRGGAYVRVVVGGHSTSMIMPVARDLGRAIKGNWMLENKDVEKVARLARLQVQPSEIAEVKAKLNGVLSWIEQLDEVDTDGALPMTSPLARGLPVREDEITAGGDPEAVLSNAPRSVDNFFVVPKVVD